MADRPADRPADRQPDRILLIGMMGAGKTTTGRLLADRLGWPYLDSDDLVEARTGRTVPAILRESGEAVFRAEERAALTAALTDQGDHTVVGVAGGAVLDAGNREVIRAAGLVVWLRAEITTLADRVGEGTDRPLLGTDPAAALVRLYAPRLALYRDLAHVALDVDDLAPSEVVDRIEAALMAAGAEPNPDRGARDA